MWPLYFFDDWFNFDKYDHSGQGVVFKLIGDFFAAEKQRAAIWYSVQSLPNHKQPVLNRKTTRSLVAPLPNKGWKQKR